MTTPTFRRVPIPHNDPGVVSTVAPVPTCKADVLTVLKSGRRLTLAGLLAAWVVQGLDGRWEEKEIRFTLDALVQAGHVDYRAGELPPRGYQLVRATPANVAGNANNGAARPPRAAAR